MWWSRADTNNSDNNFSWLGALADAIQSEPIALVALILAGTVGVVGWIHNRQSIRPILRFRIATILNPFSLKITLHNVGLGPAVVTKWSETVLERRRRDIASGCFRGLDKDSFLTKVTKAYMAIMFA